MQCLSSPTMLDGAKELRDELIAYRRQIHQNPELSFHEYETAKLVAEALRGFGYDVTEGVGGTGVVASIRTAGYEGKYVAIRADMDALPIGEANACGYTSRNTGVMHACGHDAHVACALGAAKLLSERIREGKVQAAIRMLFQPAEESVNADGKSGATLMMDEGALDDVSCLIALHVFPGIPCGKVAIRDEFLLAACDTFKIKIRGKGCHGAQPEMGVDSIVVATQLIQALQTIVSRRKPANDAGVLTVGGIRSSTFAPNIVAEEVELIGTVRYFKPELHDMFRREITQTCSMIQTFGATFELEYQHETPALWNDPQITNVVRQAAESLLGKQSVLELGQQLGADDFSFYTARVPSCYFILGVSIDERETDLHSPNFDLNEDALPLGAAMLAESAIRLAQLNSSGNGLG